MQISDQRRNSWRVPLILFTAAFFAALFLATVDSRRSEDSHPSPRQIPGASTSAVLEKPAAAVTLAPTPVERNQVLQMPGPPDPRAEQSAALSASRAADAAAKLAASASASAR
jgi:hypothetical protein